MGLYRIWCILRFVVLLPKATARCLMRPCYVFEFFSHASRCLTGGLMSATVFRGLLARSGPADECVVSSVDLHSFGAESHDLFKVALLILKPTFSKHEQFSRCFSKTDFAYRALFPRCRWDPGRSTRRDSPASSRVSSVSRGRLFQTLVGSLSTPVYLLDLTSARTWTISQVKRISSSGGPCLLLRLELR
jgi:hypothetical protein